MRQPTSPSPVSASRRTRVVLALTAAVVLCIVALLVVLLSQLLRPQPDLRMRVMPAAAPLSELQQVLVTTTGWRRGETVTICLAQPDALGCSPDAVVAEEEASREGLVEVTVQAEAFLAQGLTRVVAVGESSGAVGRTLRILQEPVALARPAGALSATNTPLPDITPSSVVSATATVALPPTPTPVELAANGFWRGEFFANIDLAGAPVATRSDPALVFDWGVAAPDPVLPADGFSARWTTQQSFLGRRYRFAVLADDGVRITIDGEVVLDEWHDVTPESTYVFALNLTPGVHTLVVEYYENTGEAFLDLTWQIDDNYPEWRGEYFANVDFTGEPVLVRNDQVLEFDWGPASPAPGVLPDDGFSVRWTRTLPFLADNYRFDIIADDGARLYVDGQLALDLWRGATSAQPGVVDWPMHEGSHEVRVEFFEDVGDAKIRVDWYPAPAALPGDDTSIALSTATPAANDLTSPIATPTATPTVALRAVTVQPAQGWAGTNLTVSSSGWEPNSIVMLALLELSANIDQADDIWETSADSAGNVTVQLQFPDEARWKALPQVQVILHNEEWTARGAAVFTLVQP